MYDNSPPKIYVGDVPDEELNAIPTDVTCLTADYFNGYIVNDDIEGLARPNADIPISALAGTNASRIGDSRITERNIVFDIVCPPTDVDRQNLYRILPFDTMRRFYFVRGNKQVFIDGKVEKLSGNFKPGKPFTFTVSIICPFPWFQSVSLHDSTLGNGGTTSLVNMGDIPSGFTFYIDEPTDGTVINYMRNFSFTVGGSTFKTKESTGKSHSFGVPMIFCTIPGQKMFYVQVNGIYTSMAYSLIDPSSEWVMLPPGYHSVKVQCTTFLQQSTDDFNKWDLMHFTWRDTYSGV